MEKRKLDNSGFVQEVVFPVACKGLIAIAGCEVEKRKLDISGFVQEVVFPEGCKGLTAISCKLRSDDGSGR